MRLSSAAAGGWALALGLVVACLGCRTTALPVEELPATPIAFRFRTIDEAERLAEARARSEKGPGSSRPGEQRAVVDLNALGERMGVAAGAGERLAATLGKVALYHPRSETLEVVEWAPRGTRPLAWSPDRKKLLFLMVQRGTTGIFEYDLETELLVPVVSSQRRHLAASYGPDGTIVFSRVDPVDRQGRGGIRLHLLDVATGRSRPLTQGPTDSKPVVPAKGRFVVFEQRDAQGRSRIARLDLRDPAAEPQVLAMGQDPSVTPDGEWVVYAAPLRGDLRLWRMRPDGSAKQGIGPHLTGVMESDPHVSPDGRFVVFVSRELDRLRLLVRPLAGGPTWPLITEGEGLEPVW